MPVGIWRFHCMMIARHWTLPLYTLTHRSDYWTSTTNQQHWRIRRWSWHCPVKHSQTSSLFPLSLIVCTLFVVPSVKSVAHILSNMCEIMFLCNNWIIADFILYVKFLSENVHLKNQGGGLCIIRKHHVFNERVYC